MELSKNIQSSYEEEITKFKEYYTEQLINLKNKFVIIQKLKSYIDKIEEDNPFDRIFFERDIEKEKLSKEIINFIKNTFSDKVFKDFSKTIKFNANNYESGDDIFLKLLELPEKLNETRNASAKYKLEFLNFLYRCLSQYGLHPNIWKRIPEKYKRYNILIKHLNNTKNNFLEIKLLINQDQLNKECLVPYSKKIPVKINGKFIPFEEISAVKITSTLLKDDEVLLFVKKENFTLSHTSPKNNKIKFLNLCDDETDDLIENPFINEINPQIFKNNGIEFVHESRIQELKLIKNPNYDLSKLVKLCEELNFAAKNDLLYSMCFLMRAIIDHIPPIFSFNNFNEIANNYNGGGRSIKNNLLNLRNSLKNIADAHIHTQIRKSELTVNIKQVDFSNDFDILLGEVIRILKQNYI